MEIDKTIIKDLITVLKLRKQLDNILDDLERMGHDRTAAQEEIEGFYELNRLPNED